MNNHRRVGPPNFVAIPTTPISPLSNSSINGGGSKSLDEITLVAGFVLFAVVLLFIVTCLWACHRSDIYAGNYGHGVARSVAEQFPVILYEAFLGREEGLRCPICVMDFETTEFIRLLPKCKHIFHIGCFYQWFDTHKTCPLCRRSVEDTDVNLIPDLNITEQPILAEQDPTDGGFVLVRRHSWAAGQSTTNPSENTETEQKDNVEGEGGDVDDDLPPRHRRLRSW